VHVLNWLLRIAQIVLSYPEDKTRRPILPIISHQHQHIGSLATLRNAKNASWNLLCYAHHTLRIGPWIEGPLYGMKDLLPSLGSNMCASHKAVRSRRESLLSHKAEYRGINSSSQLLREKTSSALKLLFIV
jgi:hypothetical protein